MMTRTYLILTILLLITTSVRAQQNTIVGTWQLDLPNTLKLMDNTVKQKFNSLDQSVKERAEISMTGRSFSFAANGSVTVNWKAQGTERVSSGTWQVNGETISVTVNGEVQQFTYELTAGSHLILRNTESSGFFSNLYLIWQP